MKYTVAILAALAARASADSWPATTPASTATSTAETTEASQSGSGSGTGCQETVEGPFKLTIVEPQSEKRNVDIDELENADCDAGGLVLTLQDGILKDQDSRSGYISANFQLQFDSPPQSGALVDSGFSLCRDGNLALRGATTFFECPTGDAWNLYDRHWAQHCGAVKLAAKPCGEVEGVEGSTVVVPTKVITELEDGQARVKSTDVGKIICQLEDGQVRGHTAGCISTAQITGTGTAPSATSMVHNHTASAPAAPEDPSAPATPEDPSATDDDEGAGMALQVSAACAGLALGYFVMAALL